MPPSYNQPIVAYQRIGTVEFVSDVSALPLRPPRTGECGALVYWPRTLWLDIEAEVVGSPKPIRFPDDPADPTVRAARLLATCRTYGADKVELGQRVCSEAWQKVNDFRAGGMPAGTTLRLLAYADTNTEAFCKAATGAAECPAVDVMVMFFRYYPDGTEDVSETRVTLRFTPATPVGPATAFVALDLGNTNSTVAALPEGADRTGQVVMLGITQELGRGDQLGALGLALPAIPSDVRVDRVRTWLKRGEIELPDRRFPQRAEDDRPSAVEWKIGELVRRTAGTTPRSLVLGSKRLAATRGGRTTVEVVAAHRVVRDRANGQMTTDQVDRKEIAFDCRVPLELLACRLLAHYREAARAWPSQLAVTYPTTYSRYELSQLRRAVHKGWLRMQHRTTPGDTPPAPADKIARAVRQLASGTGPTDLRQSDPLIRLLIDEASAAAFFYVYRRIFEGVIRPGLDSDTYPGGLVSFEYLEERGLNLLLYDCGGGTTDIALVRATVRRDGAAANTLAITVRGRSGVRDFGGDDVTRAVARLVKAKLIHALLQLGQDAPPFASPSRPTGPKTGITTGGPDLDDLARTGLALEKFIATADAADPTDRLVPTRKVGDRWTDDRRDCTLELWRLSEELKHALAEKDKVELPRWQDPNTNSLAAALLGREPDRLNAHRDAVSQVVIHRWEVDALVAGKVRRSIDNCNELIARKLRSQGPAEEVHWVVASGKAVQYPLLTAALKAHLHVAAVDEDERFTFDKENAKDATAKGAVLALATQESNGKIRVDFDSDLANRLPYDVGYWDYTVQQPRLLYSEHTLYEELKGLPPVQVPMATVPPEKDAAGAAARSFTLLRRFPGDPEFTDFLRFSFSDGIRTDLLVSYTDDEFEFKVTDQTGGVAGRPTDLTDGAVYVAPAMRGDV